MKASQFAAFAAITSIRLALADGAPSLPIVDQVRPALYKSSFEVQCPIEIDPGRAFGPIRLGLSPSLYLSSKYDPKDIKLFPDWHLVGPFAIRSGDQGVVSGIAAELEDLPPCVTYKNQPIDPSSSIESLSKLFPGCKKEKEKYAEGSRILPSGGTLIQCQGVAISFEGWGSKQKTASIRIPY
jgi:hypothetical protein